MDEFFIGETNFGVEHEKSHFGVTKAADGRSLLTVEIQGNEKTYADVTADDDSEWSWTLYPPYFYLRDYPVPEIANPQERTITLKPEDSDEFDLALYLMEHYDVEGVTVTVGANRIGISGRVDLAGEPRDFRINWKK